ATGGSSGSIGAPRDGRIAAVYLTPACAVKNLPGAVRPASHWPGLGRTGGTPVPPNPEPCDRAAPDTHRASRKVRSPGPPTRQPGRAPTRPSGDGSRHAGFTLRSRRRGDSLIAANSLATSVPGPLSALDLLGRGEPEAAPQGSVALYRTAGA